MSFSTKDTILDYCKLNNIEVSDETAEKFETLSESTKFTPAEIKIMYRSLHMVCADFLKETGTIPFMDHAILLERLRTMQ